MLGLGDSTSEANQPITGRRGEARLRLCLPARLQTMYDTRRCIILDLSRTGAQLGLEKPLNNGQSAILELHIPKGIGLDQFGTIIRQGETLQGAAIGLQFETPLSKEDVLSVRHFAETFEEDAKRSLRNEARAWVDGKNRD